MAFKTGIILCLQLLGSLAIPEPETDLSIFFENADVSPARIVGGTVAADGSFPWMAALINGPSGFYLCGGAVIAPRTILTAGHCIPPLRRSGSLSDTADVVVGTNIWTTGGLRLSLRDSLIHPNFNITTIKNDIGALYTSTIIQYSNNLRPATISYNFVGHGVPTTAAGWGRTSANGPVSARLLEILVSTLSGAECMAHAQRTAQSMNLRLPPIEPRIELCTFHSKGRGTCRGDSGSALIHTDTRELVGIVSWGIPCAVGGPDMYVRVSAFRWWIQQATRN